MLIWPIWSTEPYDLVVFDEAHKLSADRQPDFGVRKTERYRLAEAIAGAGTGDTRWALPWSAQHLLLLTATPHMGKDHPYYYLWRLLLPETLSTYDAFEQFSTRSQGIGTLSAAPKRSWSISTALLSIRQENAIR